MRPDTEAAEIKLTGLLLRSKVESVNFTGLDTVPNAVWVDQRLGASHMEVLPLISGMSTPIFWETPPVDRLESGPEIAVGAHQRSLNAEVSKPPNVKVLPPAVPVPPAPITVVPPGAGKPGPVMASA